MRPGSDGLWLKAKRVADLSWETVRRSIPTFCTSHTWWACPTLAVSRGAAWTILPVLRTAPGERSADRTDASSPRTTRAPPAGWCSQPGRSPTLASTGAPAPPYWTPSCGLDNLGENSRCPLRRSPQLNFTRQAFHMTLTCGTAPELWSLLWLAAERNVQPSIDTTGY